MNIIKKIKSIFGNTDEAAEAAEAFESSGTYQRLVYSLELLANACLYMDRLLGDIKHAQSQAERAAARKEAIKCGGGMILHFTAISVEYANYSIEPVKSTQIQVNGLGDLCRLALKYSTEMLTLCALDGPTVINTPEAVELASKINSLGSRLVNYITERDE